MGEILAKQEEKIGQRKLQINPFGMLMKTSHRQCPRGGGACECPRVGVFFNRGFGRVDDVTRAMSKGGGGCLWLSV